MAKKDTSKKGTAGKKTGGTARSLINKAQAKGKTNTQIGKSTNRSGNTISQIDRGTIKNPPKSLIGKLKKTAGGKATKRKK